MEILSVAVASTQSCLAKHTLSIFSFMVSKTLSFSSALRLCGTSVVGTCAQNMEGTFKALLNPLTAQVSVHYNLQRLHVQNVSVLQMVIEAQSKMHLEQ